MRKDAVHKGERTVFIVYASPGPVMSVSDAADQLAKVIPGMSLLLAMNQNKRDLKASKELQERMPFWQPDKVFYPILMRELAAGGYEGRLVAPADAGLTDDALKNLNRADDIIDWQSRYLTRTPDHAPQAVPRDYSMLPSLSDALVLEVNLAYGAPEDGEDHWTPTLTAVMKLYRARSMELLWRHEETLEDKPGMKRSVEFMSKPADLIARYETLMPALAQSMSASFKTNVQYAGAAAAAAGGGSP